MKIAECLEIMIVFYNGSLHDINHFLKVFAYAKTIGEQENLDNTTLEILEAAAIVHDIACPLCREKYGNTNGKAQEVEGEILARQFLRELSFDEAFIERVCYLVAHHHTYAEVNGMDYQILLEADFLVNADESNLPMNNIKNMMEHMFKTETGIRLLKSIYNITDT